MDSKKISDSMVEMRDLVLPNDTNLLGNGKPHQVPGLLLETDEERFENQKAGKRREARLIRRSSNCSSC